MTSEQQALPFCCRSAALELLRCGRADSWYFSRNVTSFWLQHIRCCCSAFAGVVGLCVSLRLECFSCFTSAPTVMACQGSPARAVLQHTPDPLCLFHLSGLLLCLRVPREHRMHTIECLLDSEFPQGSAKCTGSGTAGSNAVRN
jgi:hypothetical protein